MVGRKPAWTDQQVEQIIGNLLRVGVILAAVVVSLGGVLYLVRHGFHPADYRVFRGEPASLRGLGGIVGDACRLRARAIIQLGLLVLMATPVARVVLSAFAFVRQRDGLYVAVTSIVLTILLYSLIAGT